MCPGARLSQYSVVHQISLSGGLIAFIFVYKKKANICKDMKNSYNFEPNVMHFSETTRNSQHTLWNVWSPLSILMGRSCSGPSIPAISLLFVCKTEPGLPVYDTVIKRTLAIHSCIQFNSCMCCCCPSCGAICLSLQSLKIVCVGG